MSHSTALSRVSLFGPPLARTILPHSLALPLHNPIHSIPGLLDYLSHSHRVSLIQLFGDPIPYQMLPITIKC